MPATEQYPWPTVWVPFVPVHAANGAMQFIPGSHRQPIQEHRKSDGAAYAHAGSATRRRGARW